MADEPTVEMFVRILAIERSTAETLVANEITTIEEIAYVPEDELLSIKELDQGLVPLLRQRARSHLLRDVMGKQ